MMLWNEFWGASKISIKKKSAALCLTFRLRKSKNELNFVKKKIVDNNYFGGLDKENATVNKKVKVKWMLK